MNTISDYTLRKMLAVREVTDRYADTHKIKPSVMTAANRAIDAESALLEHLIRHNINSPEMLTLVHRCAMALNDLTFEAFLASTIDDSD